MFCLPYQKEGSRPLIFGSGPSKLHLPLGSLPLMVCPPPGGQHLWCFLSKISRMPSAGPCTLIRAPFTAFAAFPEANVTRAVLKCPDSISGSCVSSSKLSSSCFSFPTHQVEAVLAGLCRAVLLHPHCMVALLKSLVFVCLFVF